ncbi:hypothetical protein DRP77_07470, partial [Candidatus Poribacteria bacterium]
PHLISPPSPPILLLTGITLSGPVAASVPLSVMPGRRRIGGEGGEMRCGVLTVRFPPGALSRPAEIEISIVKPPSLPEKGRLLSEAYRISSPDVETLRRSIELRFASPEGSIAFWDELRGRWVRLSSRSASGSIAALSNHFGIFALLSPVRVERGGFEVRGLRLYPNPLFAPEIHPLRIAYELLTPDGGPARVRIEIFSMFGRVAVVVDGEPRYPGPNLEMWDGRDEEGRPVRNGRYLLVLTAEHGGERRVSRRPVVVFK